MLAAKRLPEGGFPPEERTAATTARVASRGTWADWGPAGRRASNPPGTRDQAAWHGASPKR